MKIHKNTNSSRHVEEHMKNESRKKKYLTCDLKIMKRTLLTRKRVVTAEMRETVNLRAIKIDIRIKFLAVTKKSLKMKSKKAQ